jgi:hypothetical protein
MKLSTPDCPWCGHRTEDRGDHFACAHCGAGPPLPEPVAWYLAQAARLGQSALRLAETVMIAGCVYPPLPRYAYVEARWAARAAMRAVPGLRE